MNRIYLAAMIYLFAGIVTPPVMASETSVNQSHTYVLVHGVTGGGWDWKGVSDLLTQDNHVVYRATLTGLGESPSCQSGHIIDHSHRRCG